MRIVRRHKLSRIAAVLMAGLSIFITTPQGWAASHREAPLIALDPTADITDVYFFRSWERPDHVVVIMNVIPGQEPSSGPNYFNFDDDVLYALNLDLNSDGKADDLVYEIRFKSEVRGIVKDLGLPVAYAAVPPITALDGPGSEGLGLRQRFTVTEVRGGHRTDVGASSMFAVPSNVGPRTMPNYEALAAQGIYPLANGGRVFAGQRDETFYIDLGAVFDTVNLRRSPPILTPEEDGNDSANPFGVDAFSGFNINTIAIEVPISALATPDAVIGLYASTSRQKNRQLKDKEDGDRDGKPGQSGKFVQVARMANPLVNELLIATDTKDKWNASEPENEAQFVDFYLKPRLVTVLNLLFGTSFPDTGREDLVTALLKYPAPQPPPPGCSGQNQCSELLRLDLAVDPAEPADQKRLGGLVTDTAGFPNGRRPNDDVTDIVLRVAAGALLGSVPALGDGVNFNIGAQGSNLTTNGIYTVFPFLPTPFDGRNRRHIDCAEPDGNPCNGP